MTDYVLDGHDLSELLDISKRPVSFADDPREYIPNKGSIIYSVWDRNERFIYVGISGLQKSLDRRNPVSRMISHASGLRSGDQFCVYVHDFFVIPELIKSGSYEPSRGVLDKLTKDYVRNNLFYRFVSFTADNSDEIVRSLETKIKTGALGSRPFLNGSD